MAVRLLRFCAIVLTGLPGAESMQAPRVTSLMVSAVFLVLATLTMRAGRGMFDRAFFARGYPWLRRLGEALALALLLVQPLILVLDVNGFHFTAQALQYRTFLSIVVLVLTKLVIDTGMLGLAIAARRSQAALNEESGPEAVAAEAAGLEVPPAPELELVPELAERLAQDPDLATAFDALTPGRQREYNLHIGEAKKSETRQSRIDKHTNRILARKGLRDR